jgi:hypothetical protein
MTDAPVSPDAPEAEAVDQMPEPSPSPQPEPEKELRCTICGLSACWTK